MSHLLWNDIHNIMNPQKKMLLTTWCKLWHGKLPWNKHSRRKTWFTMVGEKRMFYFSWVRQAKGRYSGLVKTWYFPLVGRNVKWEVKGVLNSLWENVTALMNIHPIIAATFGCFDLLPSRVTLTLNFTLVH